MDKKYSEVSPLNGQVLAAQDALLRYARFEAHDPLAEKALEEAHTQFALIYEETVDGLYRTALRMTRDHHAAEDVLQETYRRAFHSLVKFRGDSEFSTWINRIARNCAKNYIKKHSARDSRESSLSTLDAYGHPLSEQLEDPVEPFEDRVIEYVDCEEDIQRLREIVSELPPASRATITLHYLSGMAIAQVADELKISNVTVRVRLHRTRKILHEKLRPSLDDSIAID